MSPSDRIVQLLKSSHIDFEQLEGALDAANHRERVEAVYQFNRKIQRRLYEQAEGRALTLDQFCPVDENYRPVHHWGKNTILPGVDHFQKRFTRIPGKPDTLYGYNETWYRFAISPGYYVAYEDSDNGEVVIDYTRLPEDRPDDWPKILPNWYGLGTFIYFGMQDRMRRVSEHVTIGRAFKKDKALNAWFVLVREA